MSVWLSTFSINIKSKSYKYNISIFIIAKDVPDASLLALALLEP